MWSHDQLRVHIRYNCYIPTSQAEMDSSLVWCQDKIFHPGNKIPFLLVENELNAKKHQKNTTVLERPMFHFNDPGRKSIAPCAFYFYFIRDNDWCSTLWPSFGSWSSSSETKTPHLGFEVVSNAQWPGIVTQDSRSVRSVRRGCVRVVSEPSFFWVVLYCRTWELLYIYISLLAVNDVVCMPLYALVRW